MSRASVSAAGASGAEQRLVKEAQALARLRALREDAARQTLQRRREQHQQCQCAVDRRVARIAELRQARRTLVDWLSGAGAVHVPRNTPYVGARLAVLGDEVERAEYELIDERNALQRAARELAEATQAWLRERARLQAVQQLAEGARRTLDAAQELRLERETEARPMGLLPL